MNNVEVNIHLFRGNHYAIQDRHDALNIYIEKEAIDLFQLNIDLHVRPLFCDHLIDGKTKPKAEHCSQRHEKITIYNKIRERFQFKVYAHLQLLNIVIDSMDSVLPLGSKCLSERRPCCILNNPEAEASLYKADVTDYDSSAND